MTVDWAAVNAGLMVVVVFLLGWIRNDVGRVTRRVDDHLDGHP
jgi:hypothetical protein